MFAITSRKRFLCLVLSLCLVAQPLILTADNESGSAAEAGTFDPAQAVSPQEYLEKIKELRGADRQEIEMHSWGQWGMIMTNVFLLLDPKATDVPSYQNAVGKVLKTQGKVRNILAGNNKWLKAFGKATTWGLSHFAGGDGALARASNNLLRAWQWVGNRPALQRTVEWAKFMKAPSGKNAAGSFQQWLSRKPPTEGSPAMSNMAGAATIVGTVLQILAGCAEIKAFFDARGDDAGTVSWGTVQHAVTGTLLIATAVMALIPPPGVWAVAAVVIMLVWSRLKDILNRIGDKIQKWHKVYEDSLTFLKEMDDEFAAFLSENSDSTVFGCDQEKSAALKFADEMLVALREEPGEGEVAERQRDLVQNMRQQGLLTTYYYQQATATRELPTRKDDLYTIWNHRADYMAWKPEPPKNWYDAGGWVDAGIDWVGQEITNSDGKMEDDLDRYRHRVFFCPDFALQVLFRNFIMHKRTQGLAELPDLYSLVGVRIEQAPFNYIPLVDIYNNNFVAWSDDVLREAFAADSFNVGSKELPLVKEQINAKKDELENAFGSLLLKMQAMDPESDRGTNDSGRRILKQRLEFQMHALARIRSSLDALADAWLDDKDQNIKDLRVDYEFKDRNDDFKLVDEMFDGRDMVRTAGRYAAALPEAHTGILKGEDKPADEDRTPAFIMRTFGSDLARTLQCCVNSLGITGIDVVQIGLQAKSTLDVLALAQKACDDRREALDSFDEIFQSEAFRRLIEKGEYLDVKHSGLSNFFSGFDPPKDMLDHEIGKFREAIEDTRKKVEEQRDEIKELQELVKTEYEKWLALLQKYEQNADDFGVTIALSAADEKYRPELLDFITDITPLDPEQEIPQAGGE